ncbi:hypothetical protein F5X99DRAFT_431268 [Biscogniauxia marginata]|nr:hypothetical protein F5X99DRAFT_431268 [Biscogniauxia marginata]
MAMNDVLLSPSFLPIRPAPFNKHTSSPTSISDPRAVKDITQWLQGTEDLTKNVGSNQKPAYEGQVPLETVSDNILWEIFLEALSSLERVYFVIDLLHEVPALLLHHLANRLKSLAKFRPREVKLLLIGQLKDRLKGFLDAVAPFMIRIDLKNRTLGSLEERASATVEKTYKLFRSVICGKDLDSYSPNLGGQATGSLGHVSLLAKLSHGAIRPGSDTTRLNGMEIARMQLVRFLLERGLEASSNTRLPIHHLFAYVNWGVACLEVFFEYTHNPDFNFNKRDSYGMTVFHSACDMVVMDVTYILPVNAHLRPVEIWYRATGLFLKMLAYGADGHMCEDHILAFLSQSFAKSLATAKDSSASQWLCLQPEHRSGTITEKKETTDMYLSRVLTLWRRFISLGGSINARDRKGNPPLFSYLASSGPRLPSQFRQGNGKRICYHLEYFDIFFKAYGADLTLRNNTGQTALHIVAGRTGQEEVDRQEEYDVALFSFLLHRGLDPLVKDIDGKTSIDVAKKLGKNGIIRLVEGVCKEDVESVD